MREIGFSDDWAVQLTEQVSIKASTHLWLVWARIAIERFHEANRAREEL